MRKKQTAVKRNFRLMWVFLLVLVMMVFSLCSISYADSEIIPSDNASSIFLSTHGSVFSLRLPTKLSFSPKDEGGAYCADNVLIRSYSSGGADIKSISIIPPYGWELSASTSLSSSDKDRCASFRFQDTAIPGNGKADILSMNHIDGKGDTPVFYSVNTSNPSSELYSVLCADTVVTVGWDIIY